MTIREILRSKGSEVYTIAPDATAFAAVQMMVLHGIGSLAVVEGTTLMGMLTERDYLRKIVIEGRAPAMTRVREIMTPRVVVAGPADEIEASLAVMTEHRVRHLPVMARGSLIGMISMGDLVKHKLAKKELEVSQLVEYIQTAGVSAI